MNAEQSYHPHHPIENTLTLPNFIRRGELFYYKTVRGQALYQTIRRRPWRGRAYQTLRRLGDFFFYYKNVRGHFLPDYAAAEAPRRGEGFESCARVLLPHSLTTRLHGERQNKLRCLLPAVLHTLHKSRDPLIVYRDGYGGTSTTLYGGRACYETVRRLSSLCNQPTRLRRRRQLLLLLLLFFSPNRKQIFLILSLFTYYTLTFTAT